MKTLEDKIEGILYELLSLGGGDGATLTKYAGRIARQARRDLQPKKVGRNFVAALKPAKR